MSLRLPAVRPNIAIDTRAMAAADRYRTAWTCANDRSIWPMKIAMATNLWLWHLDAFARQEDPVPLFADAFDRATRLLDTVRESGVIGGHFSGPSVAGLDPQNFEDRVSGLFSDVWVDMTDDIYFDQSYEFTKERLEKNGINPEQLFGGKRVLDAGCGSGKFSAAIARFGAAKVIGMDIGEKGLDFARQQAAKVPYGHRLEYRVGSLLDIPLDTASVDMVWSNGVIHHTLDYERCIAEFARVTRPGGTLFLYVNGRFGLFELLQDTMRKTMVDIPRALTQHCLHAFGVDAGRLYWLMDCLYSPYEWKSKPEVEALLVKHDYADIRQLTRGVAIDQIEQISTGLPYARVKYGEGQLKFFARRR
ncbi:MAG: methyltransferase domain-containing protein [bacterium]|nr:methyltransferase domain-containing protein [bacterium]